MAFPTPGPPPRCTPWLELMGEYVTDNFLFQEHGNLFPQQREALMGVKEWITHPEHTQFTSVVVMPTGTGKSGVICCLPFGLGKIASENPGGRIIDLHKPILVLAPGRDILKQLEDDLCLRFASSGKKPFLINRYPEFEAQLRDSYYRTYVVRSNTDREFGGSEVVLANVQRLRDLSRLPADRFSAVIVDEAHHLPAPQWLNIVARFQGHAKITFFTATPFRSDGQEITVDRALSIHGYAYHLTIEQAVDDNLIRRVEFDETDSNNNDEAELAILMKVKECLRDKEAQIPLPGQAHHVAIIATKNVDAAERVCGLCINQLGYSAADIVSVNCESVPPNRRHSVIQEIQEGRYKIIIVVAMLLEGFDYPPISIAGILTKITSNVKFAQFVGRIRRKVRNPELESSDIVGNIISDKRFNQRSMYDEYIMPRIPLQWRPEQDEEEDMAVE